MTLARTTIVSVGSGGVGSSSVIYAPSAASVDVSTVWNSADKGASITLTDGDLRVTASASDWDMVRATASAATGKRYFEVVATSLTSGRLMFGVAKAAATLTGFVGIDANGWSIQPGSQLKWTGNVSAGYTITTPSNGDVYGIFLDITAGTLKVSRNGVECNGGTAAFTGLSGTFFPACSAFAVASGNGLARFARSTWSYAQSDYLQWGE